MPVSSRLQVQKFDAGVEPERGCWAVVRVIHTLFGAE